MSKVMINMKKPKRCYDCKFFDHSYSFVWERDIDECVIEKSLIMCDPEKGKPDWCPLKESNLRGSSSTSRARR